MANPSRRRGRIAQLPKDIRDEVNRMIENNARSSAIIRFLVEKPQNYIRLLNSLGRLSRDGRDYEQHRFQLALRQRELDEAMGLPTNGGVTPEILENITETLNLL